MDGFGSDFSSSAGSGKMDTEHIMEQVKVQIAVANAQELLQASTTNFLNPNSGLIAELWQIIVNPVVP